MEQEGVVPVQVFEFGVDLQLRKETPGPGFQVVQEPGGQVLGSGQHQLSHGGGQAPRGNHDVGQHLMELLGEKEGPAVEDLLRMEEQATCIGEGVEGNEHQQVIQRLAGVCFGQIAPDLFGSRRQGGVGPRGSGGCLSVPVIQGVEDVDFHAQDGGQAAFPGGPVELYMAHDVAVVGQGHRRPAILRGLCHQVLRPHHTVEERVVGVVVNAKEHGWLRRTSRGHAKTARQGTAQTGFGAEGVGLVLPSGGYRVAGAQRAEDRHESGPGSRTGAASGRHPEPFRPDSAIPPSYLGTSEHP